MPAYTPTVWANGVAPPISAANLNNLEAMIASTIHEVGSHLVEQSTNNLATTALSTVGGLTIETDEWILVVHQYRKDAAGAFDASIGLELNATEVKAPQVVTGAAASATSGVVYWFIGPREANYLLPPAIGFWQARFSSGQFTWSAAVLAAPAAQITDITVKGLVGNGAITLSTKNLYVYTFGG